MSYANFTQMLIDKFDEKVSELHFKQLAQLKQIGSVEEYAGEFERVSVMVQNVTERELVNLFNKGLSESLRGWVRASETTSL